MSDNGNGTQTRLRFWEYRPADYTASTKTYPLMIFLHGAGETSQNDNASADATEYARVLQNGPPKMIKNGHDMCFTYNGQKSCFIVISPQATDADGWWTVGRIRHILDYAKSNPRVDVSRIYLTGLSMGGGGTWAFARSQGYTPVHFYATELAAIVPIAGADSVSASACNMANQALPVWAFHGTSDTTVSIGQSRDFIAALTGGTASNGVHCNANPATTLLTALPGVGHGGSWETAYNPANRFNVLTAQPDASGLNIYEWMLSKTRIPPATETTRLLAAGTYHSLGVLNGVARAWGSNRAGEMGLGNNAPSNNANPVAISLSDELAAVSAGGYQSLALNKGGRVWSFGANEAGQRGDGSAFTDLNGNGTPVLVPGLDHVVAISSGGRHNLALRDDGSVHAWGSDDNGQVGRGQATQDTPCGVTVGTTTDTYKVSTPFRIAIPVKIRKISAGYCNSMALDENGEVWTWGFGDYQSAILGQGVKAGQTASLPAKIAGLTDVTDISAGDACAFAVRQDGTAWAWGVNRQGCVGDGTRSVRASPVQLALSNVRKIVARAQGAFAIRSDGSLWSWGESMYGSVGDGTMVSLPKLDTPNFTYVTSPVRIQSWADVLSVHSGSSSNHVFVVRADEKVWTWGRNKSGNLGNGSVGDADSTNTTPDDKNIGTPVMLAF